MQDADLAFEKSDVDATILSDVISIKNPKSGTIRVNSVQEIINDASGDGSSDNFCKIIVNK